MLANKGAQLARVSIQPTMWESALPSLAKYYEEKGIIFDS